MATSNVAQTSTPANQQVIASQGQSQGEDFSEMRLSDYNSLIEARMRARSENTQHAYDEIILHNGNQFKYQKEIGRGSFGIVYLYQDQQSGTKVAVKVAISGNKQAAKSMNYENYVHRNLIKNGMTLLPKFIKDGYFGDCPYIMSEYV